MTGAEAILSGIVALGAAVFAANLQRPKKRSEAVPTSSTTPVVVHGRVNVEVPSMMAARTRWVVGTGPDFILALPGVEHQPAGWSEVGFDDVDFDARFRVFVRSPEDAMLLREALSESVRHDLRALPGVNLRGTERRLMMRWGNSGQDHARVELATHLLARIASAGLGALEAAGELPDAHLHWPEGTGAPSASLRQGAIVARLNFSDYRWRLTGPFDGRWPPFEATVVAGETQADWPATVLRDLGLPVHTLGDARVGGAAKELSIAYERSPDGAMLASGLRLLARAAAPPSAGAFR
ncbi:MAG: hypothetical protein AAF447_07765 [Myxococcota bacterium]